jgi:biopolymer transport protein ExbB
MTCLLRTMLVLLLSLAAAAAPAEEAPGDAVAETVAEEMSLRDLLESVRSGTASRRAELEARERRFIEARDERLGLLAEAQTRRARLEAEADRLRDAYEAGEDELADLETTLDEQSGDLRDVFSVVHQVAADMLPVIQNSMVSTQLTGRAEILERLSSTDTLPSAADLRTLWTLLLEEMDESGRVARFETPIISPSGEEGVRTVTRIGTFSALADGDYLRFLPESGRLLALARQPAQANRAAALDFEAAAEPLVSIALDPSRGAILSLVVQTPELEERIAQGGLIGYLILGLGLIGVLLGLERMFVISLAARRDRAVLAGGDTDERHAIAELRRVAADADLLRDAEAMSAKMDEVVTVATQHLHRGLATLAIFAAVSPLLGLLGTVTGMIETFQVITLFGAGDPRLMSGGISQALITTQLGLAVAIPLLLIHSFLQSRANTLTTRLDELAADLFAEARARQASDAA